MAHLAVHVQKKNNNKKHTLTLLVHTTPFIYQSTWISQIIDWDSLQSTVYCSLAWFYHTPVLISVLQKVWNYQIIREITGGKGEKEKCHFIWSLYSAYTGMLTRKSRWTLNLEPHCGGLFHFVFLITVRFIEPRQMLVILSICLIIKPIIISKPRTSPAHTNLPGSVLCVRWKCTSVVPLKSRFNAAWSHLLFAH